MTETFSAKVACSGGVRAWVLTTALTDCAVLQIDKKAMMEVLHREHEFSDLFVAYLLSRNIRYEEDLIDQLFNSSEKRLARILLLLAHFRQGRQTRDCNPQNQSGDPRRDGEQLAGVSVSS